MQKWEYCEVDFNGGTTYVYYYDEAGNYIDNPTHHSRLGIMIAKLGHDGWEIISTWWRSNEKVTYMLKRPCQKEWTDSERQESQIAYRKNHPRDAKY